MKGHWSRFGKSLEQSEDCCDILIIGVMIIEDGVVVEEVMMVEVIAIPVEVVAMKVEATTVEMMAMMGWRW